MTYRVKYWPKEKTFTLTEHKSPNDKNPKVFYDGRSEEYKEWLKSSRVLWTWGQNSTVVGTSEDKKRAAIVFAIFEETKALGIIK